MQLEYTETKEKKTFAKINPRWIIDINMNDKIQFLEQNKEEYIHDKGRQRFLTWE